MFEKMYREYKRSFRLFDPGDGFGMYSAMKQLSEDHTEVFLDGLNGCCYCLVMRNKHGFYVLKAGVLDNQDKVRHSGRERYERYPFGKRVVKRSAELPRHVCMKWAQKRVC